MFDLLIEVRPRADESLLGYLHRLADANGLEGRVLQKEAKSAKCMQYLAMVHGNGAHPSWLPVHTGLAGRPLQTTRLWNLRLPRYCPACLAESLHWRARWDISLMTACGRHRLPLLDCCQNCGKQLSWDRHNSGYCLSCASPLTRTSIVQRNVPVEELWFARELEQRLMKQSRMLDPPMRQMALDRFHEIAFRVAVCLIRRVEKLPRKRRLARPMAVAQPIAYVAGKVFYKWPEGFFRILDEIRESCDEPDAQQPNVVFGLLYREISSAHVEDVGFIRSLFDTYLHRHWRHLAARLSRELEVTRPR